MKDFFEQAIQAAIRSEQQSRERDIATFKALMSKNHWDDADLDATTDLWCRAGLDPLLNEQMEALQREWLHSQGLDVTPEDVARAQKIVDRTFREYFEEP